jgi:hypothetical protein
MYVLGDGQMNISQVCADCYQNDEISNICRSANTLLCFYVGIRRSGFQQFKCKNSTSNACSQTGDHHICVLSSQSGNRRATKTTEIGC